MTFKILITDNLSPQALARLESAADIEFDIITGLSPTILSPPFPRTMALSSAAA